MLYKQKRRMSRPLLNGCSTLPFYSGLQTHAGFLVAVFVTQYPKGTYTIAGAGFEPATSGL